MDKTRQLIDSLKPGDVVAIRDLDYKNIDETPKMKYKKFRYLKQYKHFKEFEDMRGQRRCFKNWDLKDRGIKLCE